MIKNLKKVNSLFVYFLNKGKNLMIFKNHQFGTGILNSIIEIVKDSGKEYVTVKGDILTYKHDELMSIIYNNQNKIIIFDGCDDYFTTPETINVMKALLDGEVSYANSSIEMNVKFTGSAIFLNNKNSEYIDDALLSRIFTTELVINPEYSTISIQFIEEVVGYPKGMDDDKLCKYLNQLGLNHVQYMQAFDIYKGNMIGFSGHLNGSEIREVEKYSMKVPIFDGPKKSKR